MSAADRPLTEILVITPVLDGVTTLGRTLHSVAAQAGPVRLVHHVQDGGSTDGTQALLERWARLSAWGGVSTGCARYRFSWSSEPDRGLYEAVARGFATHVGDENQWLGWINADDVLMPGAAGLLAALDRDCGADGPAWVGGRTRAARQGQVITEHDRAACGELIREGLCDGLHFPPIQQEGVFFRRRLWSCIDPEHDFSRFRLAGDWNLWRAFAAHERLHQVDVALGEFTLRPGQLSAVEAKAYALEIEAELPFEARSESFARLARTGGLRRARLSASWPDGRLGIRIESADHVLAEAAERSQERAAHAALPREVVRAPVRTSLHPGGAVARPKLGVLAHDADWQTPAITERHAFEKIVELWEGAPGWVYLGFPWATLIDLQNHWSLDRLRLEAALAEAAARLPAGARVATVCQHIHATKVVPLMAGAGVTDLYWSHAVQDQARLSGVRVRPFPLYPVQGVEGSDGERDVLFSFIGSRGDAWYPTQTRTWIVDHLSKHRRGLVVERPGWHYERAVYAEQIRGEVHGAPKSEDEKEAQFKEALARSQFVLCPSGTGPNTLRLWEALDAGAIPVVLSDRAKLPGARALWEAGALFRPESEHAVRALPRELARLARDPGKMAALREGGRVLKARYGRKRFVTDILEDAAGRFG